VSCERQSVAARGFGNAIEFKQHRAGLHHRCVVFHGTFTGTHGYFWRLSGNGLVRENADPNLSSAGNLVRTDVTMNVNASAADFPSTSSIIGRYLGLRE
jgi:hypothetical protein